MMLSGYCCWRRHKHVEFCNSFYYCGYIPPYDCCTLQIFLFLVCLCLVCTVCAGLWENRYGVQFQAILPWEIFIPGSVAGDDGDQSDTAGGATIIGIMTFFSYIIILNTLVPISLYVR